MSKLKIGSVQINNGFAGQYYLPYSIGTLQAYFLKFTKNLNRYKFINPIYKRLLLDECVDYLKDCEIVVFSTYVWNINISLAVAKKLKEIEKNNILNASLLAMKRAIKKLKKKPQIVLIDGNKLPYIDNYKLKNVIKGDQKIPEISAASIIAKVSRDRLLTKMSKKFQNYLWDKNSGYGTQDHIKAIKKFGITKHHRKTFKPVHNILSLKL